MHLTFHKCSLIEEKHDVKLVQSDSTISIFGTKKDAENAKSAVIKHLEKLKQSKQNAKVDLPNAPNSSLKELLQPLMPKFEQNYQLEAL